MLFLGQRTIQLHALSGVHVEGYRNTVIKTANGMDLKVSEVWRNNYDAGDLQNVGQGQIDLENILIKIPSKWLIK